MPSPFPGMDPYLEGSLWTTFHFSFAAEIVRELAPRLRPRYLVLPEERFASGGTEHRGWQATLERYHRAYPDRAAMGTLTFDLREVRLLSPRWAVVFGGYQLERAEDRPSGLFTLLFEKRPEGWRIVHDHTSAGS